MGDSSVWSTKNERTTKKDAPLQLSRVNGANTSIQSKFRSCRTKSSAQSVGAKRLIQLLTGKAMKARTDKKAAPEIFSGVAIDVRNHAVNISYPLGGTTKFKYDFMYTKGFTWIYMFSTNDPTFAPFERVMRAVQEESRASWQVVIASTGEIAAMGGYLARVKGK